MYCLKRRILSWLRHVHICIYIYIYIINTVLLNRRHWIWSFFFSSLLLAYLISFVSYVAKYSLLIFHPRWSWQISTAIVVFDRLAGQVPKGSAHLHIRGQQLRGIFFTLYLASEDWYLATMPRLTRQPSQRSAINQSRDKCKHLTKLRLTRKS